MHSILGQNMMKNHEKLGKMPTFLVENSREFPEKKFPVPGNIFYGNSRFLNPILEGSRKGVCIAIEENASICSRVNIGSAISFDC